MISELDNYLSWLDDLHGQIADLVADLPAEALNWRPLEGKDNHVTNSLAVMAAHLAQTSEVSDPKWPLCRDFGSPAYAHRFCHPAR